MSKLSGAMPCSFNWTSLLATAIFAAPVLFGQAVKPEVLTVNVPATSNPYLAGMASGTKARVGDSAMQQSPVLVGRTLSHAVAVTFTAVGAIQHTPECPPRCNGPNGGEFHRHLDGAENGIGDVNAPVTALVGVFLSDEQPDKTRAPRPLNYRSIRRDIDTFNPQLKQVFLIGDGKTSRGARRRYLVPARATRLYLGVMDGYEWNNNSGSFTVDVAIERDQTESSMFTVDSSIAYSWWACLPERRHCTPDRSVAEQKGPGRFHVILPASSEWSISVPDVQGSATIHAAEGTVCLNPEACTGPAGLGNAAGPGFLAQDKPVGALISRTIEGRVYFSVNHRRGAPFRDHEGYFEFDVITE